MGFLYFSMEVGTEIYLFTDLIFFVSETLNYQGFITAIEDNKVFLTRFILFC